MEPKSDFKAKALEVYKKCSEESKQDYEACMERNAMLFPNAFPKQHHIYCLNQKTLKEVFCLHEEKEKAGITSSGLRSTAKTQPPPAQ
jgi:hypothetical protein